MILLQVFMQRVCSLTVYLLHLHHLSVIYFYEQKVFGGALIWQLKPQRKKRFCTYFFLKERVQLWWEGNVLHVKG